MPSTIELLPDEIKQQVDHQLAANRFSRLDEVTEFVNNLLTSQGLEMKISRSALGRYSHDKLQPLLDRIKLSTKMAEAIANACPDEKGNVSEALIRLTQEALFNKLTELECQENVSSKDLASISQAIAKIVDSSTRVKRYREEVIKKINEAAIQQRADLKQIKGLSDEAAEAIVSRILGVQL